MHRIGFLLSKESRWRWRWWWSVLPVSDLMSTVGRCPHNRVRVGVEGLASPAIEEVSGGVAARWNGEAAPPPQPQVDDGWGWWGGVGTKRRTAR
jgi:hypothetical protein